MRISIYEKLIEKECDKSHYKADTPQWGICLLYGIVLNLTFSRYCIHIPFIGVIHMETLRIYVYATYLSIASGRDGSVMSQGKFGHIRGVLDQLRELEFVPRFKRWTVKSRYYAYDIDELATLLPRHSLDSLKENLVLQELPFEIEEIEPKKGRAIKLKMNPKFVDKEAQIETIDYLTNAPHKMRATKLQTGVGKSYSAIRAITNLQQVAMVVCEGNLLEQWKKEFLDKTLIKEDKIFTIQGAGSLLKLFAKKEKPEIFLASIDTLKSYIMSANAPYTELPSYGKFLEQFEVGVKIVDEFHLNFSILITIDLQSNVLNNIYLSATPKRSGKEEEKIFNLIFPKEIISVGNAYDKYVNIYFYRYRLEFKNQLAFNTMHGYSHVKYEDYIEKNAPIRQRFVESVLYPLINIHFTNKFKSGHKLLIFCKTVSFCSLIRDYVANQYPKMDVRTYTQKDPESNLIDADIIVSTPQSCGTGKDIKGLMTVIQTCSIGSDPLTEQILGRLRKPKDGSIPEFVDIYNKSLQRHYIHYRNRSAIYKTRALKYHEHELN